MGGWALVSCCIGVAGVLLIIIFEIIKDGEGK